MKGQEGWRIAGGLAGITSLLIFLSLLVAGVPLIKVVSYSLGGGIVFFGAAVFYLYFRFYKRIQDLNTSIELSLKQRRQLRIDRRSGVDKLEHTVLQLIREKSSEIDHLKELERYRKEFLGDVAHELRSPIFNIIGYLDTLLDGAWEDPEVNQKFLKKASDNVEHLRSLVEDLVTISRIESGELILDKQQFNLIELTREVIGLLEFQAKAKNICVNIRQDNGELAHAFADRNKIKQILNNLIGNSIKYGREGGQTTVNLRNGESRDRITIEVADNGEGIAEADLPRIFERFYRADKARSRKTASTGLGLAIVKHFIEAHQQEIWVTSREGIGSIFSFTLDKASKTEN